MLWRTEPRTPVCGVEQVLQLQYRVQWLSDDVGVRNDAAQVTLQLAGFSFSLSAETLMLSRPPTISRSTPPAQRWSRPGTLGKHQASWTKASDSHSSTPGPLARRGVQPAAPCRDQRVVPLSDAVQVSRVLGEFPKPDPSLLRRESWLTSCDSGGEHTKSPSVTTRPSAMEHPARPYTGCDQQKTAR
jgi:hypothetical protein